jgi:hypothetical protein
MKFKELLFIKKKYPRKYDWPTSDYFTAANKLSNMYSNLTETFDDYTKRDDFKFDPYLNEWAVAGLESFIANCLTFCMNIDPDNREGYAEWRSKRKSTMPTKQSVPIHFAYVPFNVKRATRDYRGYEARIKSQKAMAEYRRLTKYDQRRNMSGWRWISYFERLSKWTKDAFERTGRGRRIFGLYRKPFSIISEDKEAHAFCKIVASYIIGLTMIAQEIQSRFLSGEFLDTEWKFTLNKWDYENECPK